MNRTRAPVTIIIFIRIGIRNKRWTAREQENERDTENKNKITFYIPMCNLLLIFTSTTVTPKICTEPKTVNSRTNIHVTQIDKTCALNIENSKLFRTPTFIHFNIYTQQTEPKIYFRLLRRFHSVNTKHLIRMSREQQNTKIRSLDERKEKILNENIILPKSMECDII